jgi:hypothetical protein
MSVIFQLFGAEDLQKLDYDELLELKRSITEALTPPGQATRGEPLALSLPLSPKTQPDSDPPSRVKEALNKRFHEVSHQLKTPPPNPLQPTFDFAALIAQRNAKATQDKENMLLEWAITCEVNNFEFYNSLLKAKKKADEFFAAAMKKRGETVPERLRPKGPDSLYSPFNPRHPLYNIFYDLSKPNPT